MRELTWQIGFHLFALVLLIKLNFKSNIVLAKATTEMNGKNQNQIALRNNNVKITFFNVTNN